VVVSSCPEGWKVTRLILVAILLGGVGVVALQRRLDAMASQTANLSAKIERLTEQNQLLSPADLGHHRLDIRKFVINAQLDQANSPIVIAGDSITEAALLPETICGNKVVNAGVGGMTVESYYNFASDILRDRKLSSIVFALGTNNANKIANNRTFKESYRKLIAAGREAAETVILAGIPPIDTTGVASAYFNVHSADAINAEIQQLARDNHLAFIDLRSDDAKEAGTSYDGIHLSPKGYEVWRQEITSGIESSVRCAPTAAAD
jgi:lysophospholipase L1-like esterase